jgi:hypothetical protein
MTKRINEQSWINEADGTGGAGATPESGAQGGLMGGPPTGGQPQNQPNQMSMNKQSGEEDISNDPKFPDMPQQTGEEDFHMWKIKYVKESIKGDPNTLIQSILSVRDRDLDPIHRKFVEDNLDINFLRQNSNIFAASKEVRSLIKKDFDRTNPSMTLTRHVVDTLEKQPLLNEVYIKCMGLGGSKLDQHRKFVASLLGAIQVGSGGLNEDLIFEEQDYSIRISTRFNARWGDVNIGRWYLKEDDPERYLKHAELNRLESGSPEEKDVLRRRVVMESIAEAYRERAFMIDVVGSDGTVQHLGWDLGNCLKASYLDGKLVVRTGDNDNRESFIDEEGSIISVPTMAIYYVKQGDEIGPKGKPEVEELEFITYRDGMLYLSAQLDLIKEAAQTMQGMLYRETLWQGNPSDILKIMRCVPSSPEMLLRQC